jgi:hypothetical protein
MWVSTFVFFCLAHREHIHFYYLLQLFKFPFLLVPHELEGALGHATAVAASGRPASQIASLDVGGGSFQVVAICAVHGQQTFAPHINQAAFTIAICESKVALLIGILQVCLPKTIASVPENADGPPELLMCNVAIGK